MRKQIAPVLVAGSLLAGCASGGQETSAELPPELAGDSSGIGVDVIGSSEGCQEWPETPFEWTPQQLEGPGISTDIVIDPDDIGERLKEYFTGLPVDYVGADISEHSRYILDLHVKIDPLEVPTSPPPAVEDALDSIVKVTGSTATHDMMGSGFMFLSASGFPRLVTAGHVLNGLEPESVAFTGPQEDEIYYDYFATTWQDPYDAPEFDDLSHEQQKDINEDIASVVVCYEPGMEDLLLKPRNTLENPIRIGEELWMLNYQGDRNVNDPAVYPVIYTGDDDRRFGNFMSDIQQVHEEDSLHGGGSGGVVLDRNGYVVGAATASIDDEVTGAGNPRWYACDEPYITDTIKVPGLIEEPYVYVSMDESGDECDRGVSTGSFRQIDTFGGFLINNNVETVIISNPEH